MAFMRVSLKVLPLTSVLARPEELPEVDELVVAAYNAHNLFGPDPPGGAKAKPKSADEIDALAEMILGLDASVIAFEEVQDRDTLARLFREHVNPKIKDKAERFTSFVCIPSHDPRGINVALATRLAVRATVSFTDREFGSLDEKATVFSRDLLGVELFGTPTYRFLFFVAHLKSKLARSEAEAEAGGAKRRCEASEIRSILEEPPFGATPFIDQPMLLCGDMNDDPDSEVIEVLTGGERPLRDLLDRDALSYPTHNKYKKTRFDYILASPSIVATGEVFEGAKEVAKLASDHFPVRATIEVRR